MAKSVTFKKTTTPRQRLLKMRGGMVVATDPFMDEHIALRELATEGWSDRNKPKIEKKVLYKDTRKPITWQVILTANNARGAQVSVYRLLADGTKNRHAAMSPGYSRKTIPGRFGNFGVGGQVQFVSKRFEGISPDTGARGITARNWDVIIAELLAPQFKVAIYRGGLNGLRR